METIFGIICGIVLIYIFTFDLRPTFKKWINKVVKDWDKEVTPKNY